MSIIPIPSLDPATNFVIHETVHFLLVGLIAGFFYWRYRDWRLIFAAVLIGLFIDLDHLFDFFAYYGSTFELSDFFFSGYMAASGKIYVPLHGWEDLFILGLLGFLLEKRLKIKGLTAVILLAYGSHLLWDHLCFAQHPWVYFFSYRFFNSFSIESFHGY